MSLLQEPKPSLLSMFKQTKPSEPLANKKSRLTEPQLANKKPRLSADVAAAKSGPDKAGAAPQSEQHPNLKSRSVGSYDRPWRAFMKQPSGSKANSVQGQSSQNAIAADTSKTSDPVKKLQVGAALHLQAACMTFILKVPEAASMMCHCCQTCTLELESCRQ